MWKASLKRQDLKSRRYLKFRAIMAISSVPPRVTIHYMTTADCSKDDRKHTRLQNPSGISPKMSHLPWEHGCKPPQGSVLCSGQKLASIGKNIFRVLIRKALKGRVVLLELGVGYNTPGIIRFPFESLVYQHPEVTLIRMNRDDLVGYKENKDSTVTFNEEITVIIKDIVSSKVWSS